MTFRIRHLFASTLLALSSIAPVAANELVVATGDGLVACYAVKYSRTNPFPQTRCGAVVTEYVDGGIVYHFLLSSHLRIALVATGEGQEDQEDGYVQRTVSSLLVLADDGRTIQVQGSGWCRDHNGIGVTCRYINLQDEDYWIWGGWLRGSAILVER